jgi:hypothetical protein
MPDGDDVAVGREDRKDSRLGGRGGLSVLYDGTTEDEAPDLILAERRKSLSVRIISSGLDTLALLRVRRDRDLEAVGVGQGSVGGQA